MNVHRRIRTYMEKHKVGPLFEDLMGKLVSEMPNDPIAFLIRELQHKMYEVRPQTVMTVAQLRRSLGDLASTLEVEKLPVYHKPSSSVVKRRPSTASTPTPSFRKSVTLYCPRNSSSSKLSLTINKPEAPDGNKKDGAQNPDSFLSIPKIDFKVAKVKSDQKWTGNGRLLLPGQIVEEEQLRDELIKIDQKDNFKLKNGGKADNVAHRNKGANRIEPKWENCKVKSAKENGRNIRLEKRQGIESYELPEDLATEGIFICKANGFKFLKCNPKSDPKLNFTICSTCAKVMKPEEEEDSANEEAVFDTVTSASATKSFQTYDSMLPTDVLDTERTIASEDLFATPRSLPLPITPTYQYEIDWRIPTVEFLQSGSSGWDTIKSDPDSP